MRLPIRARQIPPRVATGAFILHSGLNKWDGGAETAAGVHGMASNAFPFLKEIPPPTFLRLLSAGEIAVGSLLLAPFVPATVAGAALTGFSGSLLTMYWRTPALHEPNSIRPTHAGTAIAKDVWMLGSGLGLMIDGLGQRRRRRRRRARAKAKARAARKAQLSR